MTAPRSVRRPVLRRPVLRIGVIRGEARKDGLIVCHLVVHIFRGGFGFLQPFVCFLPLLQDDGVPRPEIFLGLL